MEFNDYLLESVPSPEPNNSNGPLTYYFPFYSLVEFSVMVLSSGIWNYGPQYDIMLPPEVRLYQFNSPFLYLYAKRFFCGYYFS